MIVEDGEAALAYTYAWWLTGDEQSARTAVLTAMDRPEVPGADAHLRTEILLRRVRAAAIQQTTMCPASELALLHDGMGLALDSAAGLAAIDSREARTELAHGRLEALGPGVEVEVVEPERLGGLAVGNPADVAAARQNPKLGRLRELILQGRDELVSVAKVEVPESFMAVVAQRRAAEQESRAADGGLVSTGTVEGVAEVYGPVDEGPTDDGMAAGHVGEGTVEVDVSALLEPPTPGADAPEDGDEPDRVEVPAAEADPVPAVEEDVPPDQDLHQDAEEVDLSHQVGDAPPPLGRPGEGVTSWFWVVVGVVLIIGVVLVLSQLGGGDEGDIEEVPTLEVPVATDDPPTAAPTADGPDPSEADEPTPGEDPAATASPSPAASSGEDLTGEDPAGEDPALAVQGTGVAVGIGADPVDGAPTADPFDPVSFEVTYSGAAEGDRLEAVWTVDGQPYGTEELVLLADATVSRFSRQTPLEGWPVGTHLLELTVPGSDEVLGTLSFVVVDSTQ